MTRLKLPWKKNFRRVPEWIVRRVQASINDELIVSCIKKITAAEIAASKYDHIGLKLVDNSPVYSAAIIPDPRVGRFSDRNANGYDIIRRDLPKVVKTFGPYTVPIFGDPSRGYCDVYPTRQVYQRDRVPAAEWKINIEFLHGDTTGTDFLFHFQLDQTLNRTAEKFDEQLFFGLNLIQENTGAATVFHANATKQEFLGTVFMPWELLPPGEDARVRILSSFSRATYEVVDRVNSRFDLLAMLNPEMFIRGTNQFDGYVGAKFSDKLVVFENLRYGNALYVMGETWQYLSQRSRLDLLRDRPDGFGRIVHTDGWEDRLRNVVMTGR